MTEEIEYYNKDNLLEVKSNINKYITTNIDNIEWKVLDYNEMNKFIDNNYNIDNKYITWKTKNNTSLLGMYYINYNLSYNKYFIGTIKNNIGKDTIVGCITYHESYYNIDIYTIEINYFYQNRKLLNEMYNRFKEVIDLKKDINISLETNKGKEVGVTKKLEMVLNKSIKKQA